MAHDSTFRNLSRRPLYNKYNNQRCSRNSLKTFTQIDTPDTDSHRKRIFLLLPYSDLAVISSNDIWFVSNFLTCEFSVLSNNIRPFSTFFNNIFDDCENFILSCADLSCRVSFTKSNCTIFDSLEINCDSKWCSKFVVSSISATNRLR
jgi:hypothetical protein